MATLREALEAAGFKASPNAEQEAREQADLIRYTPEAWLAEAAVEYTHGG